MEEKRRQNWLYIFCLAGLAVLSVATFQATRVSTWIGKNKPNLTKLTDCEMFARQLQSYSVNVNAFLAARMHKQLAISITRRRVSCFAPLVFFFFAMNDRACRCVHHWEECSLWARLLQGGKKKGGLHAPICDLDSLLSLSLPLLTPLHHLPRLM